MLEGAGDSTLGKAVRLGVSRERGAEHGAGTRAGDGQPGDHIDQGCFTGTVRPDQAEHLTGTHRQVNFAHGMHPAVGLSHPVQVHDLCAGGGQI